MARKPPFWWGCGLLMEQTTEGLLQVIFILITEEKVLHPKRCAGCSVGICKSSNFIATVKFSRSEKLDGDFF